MKRAAAALMVLGSVSCGGPPVAPTTPAAPEPSTTSSTSPAPSSETPNQELRVVADPSPAPSPTGPPKFTAEVTTIARGRLPYSWRPGCPVSYKNLRLVRMTYWGFDGKAHTGELVVNKAVTGKITTVFEKLYAMRYPIRQMKLVDAYKGSDYASIDVDNTSAFNCRPATGSTNWSNHAYGQAVDVNPRENPYVTAGGGTAHQNAKKFTERPMKGKGVINPGDKVVKAFASVGWGWGGSWSGTKDLQHFSSNGR
jgi:hypothetical protein